MDRIACPLSPTSLIVTCVGTLFVENDTCQLQALEISRAQTYALETLGNTADIWTSSLKFFCTGKLFAEMLVLKPICWFLVTLKVFQQPWHRALKCRQTGFQANKWQVCCKSWSKSLSSALPREPGGIQGICVPAIEEQEKECWSSRLSWPQTASPSTSSRQRCTQQFVSPRTTTSK